MGGILGSLFVGILSVACFALAIAAVVTLLVLNRNNNRKKTAAYLAFPCTCGRVTATGVRETVRIRPDDDPFFHAYIDFEYLLEGRIHTVRQGIGPSFNLASKAAKGLENWPVGKEVEIRYNPVNPDDAKLIVDKN